MRSLPYRLIWPLLITCSAVRAEVIAHYDFNANFNDVSGNGRHGTLTDVGVLGNTGLNSLDSVFGGGAISFSDDRDFIAIPEENFSTTATYTMAFWAKRNSPTRQYDIALGNRNDADNFLTFFYGDSPFDPFVGSLSYLRYEGNNPVDDGDRRDYAFNMGTDWHHYAYVSDGANMTIYADGVMLGSSATETAFILNTIGVGYTTSLESDMQGKMDEVWVFDQALSSSEVNSLRTVNAIPEPATGMLVVLGGLALLRRKRGRA